MKRASYFLTAGCAVLVISLVVAFRVGPPKVAQLPSQPIRRRDVATILPMPREKIGYTLLPVLLNEQVQNELAINYPQRRALESLATQYNEELATALDALQAVKARDETGASAVGAFRARQIRVVAELGRAAEAVLTDEQAHRLDQVLIRLRSIEIYSIPEIIKSLELTPEQQAGILKVRIGLEGVAQNLTDDNRSGRVRQEEFVRAIDDAFVSAEKQVLPLLTAEQRARVESWSGRPIPFTRQSLRLEIRGRVDGHKGTSDERL